MLNKLIWEGKEAASVVYGCVLEAKHKEERENNNLWGHVWT